MPGAGGDESLRPQLGGERIAARSRKGAWSPEATSIGMPESRRTSSAGRASDGDRPPWARRTARTTFSGSGPASGTGGARDPEELPQRRGVRLEAMGQELVAHALKAHQLGVVGEQVEERRLDQRQRPHLRPACASPRSAPRAAVGMRDDVGTAIEQRHEIGGVDVEVLAPVRRRWAGREAAPVDGDQRPASLQGRERRPGRRRARAAVNEQNLRPLALGAEPRSHPSSKGFCSVRRPKKRTTGLEPATSSLGSSRSTS